jgi:hypothetical protein
MPDRPLSGKPDIGADVAPLPVLPRLGHRPPSGPGASGTSIQNNSGPPHGPTGFLGDRLTVR